MQAVAVPGRWGVSTQSDPAQDPALRSEVHAPTTLPYSMIGTSQPEPAPLSIAVRRTCTSMTRSSSERR